MTSRAFALFEIQFSYFTFSRLLLSMLQAIEQECCQFIQITHNLLIINDIQI